jgi:hypothetical protein
MSWISVDVPCHVTDEFNALSGKRQLWRYGWSPYHLLQGQDIWYTKDIWSVDVGITVRQKIVNYSIPPLQARRYVVWRDNYQIFSLVLRIIRIPNGVITTVVNSCNEMQQIWDTFQTDDETFRKKSIWWGRCWGRKCRHYQVVVLIRYFVLRTRWNSEGHNVDAVMYCDPPALAWRWGKMWYMFTSCFEVRMSVVQAICDREIEVRLE